MRIVSLIPNNIELLYEIILNIQKENNCSASDIKFDNRYTELLNIINININLEDVNMYDYMLLKKKYPTVIKNTEVEYCKDAAYMQFGELSSEALADYGRFIVEDVNPKCDRDIRSFMIPLGIQTCSVSVILTGSSLGSIIGLNPVVFFAQATKNKCIKKIDEATSVFLTPDEYNFFGDDDFKNYIAQTFIRKYYEMMSDDIFKTDLNSAIGMYMYMDSALGEDGALQLCTLSNPFGIIEFLAFDVDSTKSVLNTIKEKSSLLEDKNYNAKHTSFTFMMHTDIATYCRILELLPRRCVIVTEPIINLLGRDYSVENLEYPAVLDEEFEVRVNKELTTVVGCINKLYGGADNILKKASMLFPSEKIKYMIRLTCEDANMYLYDILSADRDSISYTDALTYDILTDMSKMMGKLLGSIDS